MKKWFIVLTILGLSGCVSLPTGKFNEAENGPFSGNQLREYLTRLDIPVEGVYTLDTSGYRYVLPVVRGGIPEAELFDANGQSLSWWVPKKSLSKRLNTFLKKYPAVSPAGGVADRKLNPIRQALRSPDGYPVAPDQADDTDIHLLLYFSQESGTRGDEMLQICHELLRQHPQERIRIYLISMDKQQWWASPAKPAPGSGVKVKD